MVTPSSNIFREVKKLIAINKLEQAKLALQPLITELNDDYRVFSLLGLIYHKQGLFTRAVKNYTHAMEINPGDAETAINLSLIYNDLGKYEEGAELYSRAVSLIDTNSVENKDNSYEINLMFAKQHLNLGEIYLRYNRIQEAKVELDRALQLNPDLEAVHVSMSECISRLGKRKQAINELKAFKMRKPDFLEARIKLGHLLFLEGEIGMAIDEWEDVLVLDPANMEARMYIKMAKEESIIP